MTNCPNCGYDLNAKKSKRTCVLCKQPIRSHDKWSFNSASQCQHRCCEHPEDYSIDEHIKRMAPKPTPLFDGVAPEYCESTQISE